MICYCCLHSSKNTYVLVFFLFNALKADFKLCFASATLKPDQECLYLN